nr:hypothetical protein HmN_000113200 [Hymenolepis microstoma]
MMQRPRSPGLFPFCTALHSSIPVLTPSCCKPYHPTIFYISTKDPRNRRCAQVTFFGSNKCSVQQRSRREYCEMHNATKAEQKYLMRTGTPGRATDRVESKCDYDFEGTTFCLIHLTKSETTETWRYLVGRFVVTTAKLDLIAVKHIKGSYVKGYKIHEWTIEMNGSQRHIY